VKTQRRLQHLIARESGVLLLIVVDNLIHHGEIERGTVQDMGGFGYGQGVVFRNQNLAAIGEHPVHLRLTAP
jgi:hypothetical protein